MTFHDISMKMLISNFRSYKLYFLCNVFSVALFYCFSSIFTNKIFMDPQIVDPLISSNIFGPSLFVGIFIAVFVPYSNYAFLRNRKYEYGVLMALGMSETEVLINMLLENCLIAGLSLISGLIAGTVVSFGFYFIINHVIGISALRWYFNAASYKWTAVLYGVTILLTILTGILGLIKTQLTDLMKERFRPEKNGNSVSGIFFIAGVIIVIISVLVMIIGYGYLDEERWFPVSFIIMFSGLWLLLTHLESAEKFFAGIFPGRIRQHILENSFIRQHNRSRSRIAVIAAWLIAFSIFFGGLSATMYPHLIKNAVDYSPYDLVYSQIFGKNRVPDEEIKSLLEKNGVSIKSVKQVDYMRNGAFNLLPISQVNRELNSNYQVTEGKFLMVFQYELNDGYRREFTYPKMISFSCGGRDMQLLPAGSDFRILFNRNPTFADQTLVLNDTDFKRIASESKDYWTGTAKFYAFDDWRDSEKGISAVQKYLFEKNRADQSDQKYYRATSRIEDYTKSKQSAEFLIFLMFFIVVLFYGASNVMIHFKIKAESEEEERMLSGLYRIGVTTEEMQGMIRHKNKYYFMPQVIIGLFCGVFYNYMNNVFYGYGWRSAGYSLIAGIVLVLLQSAVVVKYSGRELKALVSKYC